MRLDEFIHPVLKMQQLMQPTEIAQTRKQNKYDLPFDRQFKHFRPQFVLEQKRDDQTTQPGRIAAADGIEKTADDLVWGTHAAVATDLRLSSRPTIPKTNSKLKNVAARDQANVEEK